MNQFNPGDRVWADSHGSNNYCRGKVVSQDDSLVLVKRANGIVGRVHESRVEMRRRRWWNVF